MQKITKDRLKFIKLSMSPTNVFADMFYKDTTTADVDINQTSSSTVATDTWYEIGLTSNATRDTTLFINGVLDY